MTTPVRVVGYLLGLVDDVPVACADVELPHWDNRDLAWINVNVHPGHRRRGLGSELMRYALDLVRSIGRTKAGTNGFEGHGTAEFAAAPMNTSSNDP